MEPTQHSCFTPSQLNSQLLNQPSKDRRNKWRKFLQTGLNQNRPPPAPFSTLDLSKAFDMVCHRTLVELIHDTPLPRGIVRWLSNYFNGRQVTTLYNNQESPRKIVQCGVPQGSVLSPTLFIFTSMTLPHPPIMFVSHLTLTISIPFPKALM